jgi:hypothetical protein
MTRDEWRANKRTAIEKRRRQFLALRIRVACGGLPLVDRNLIAAVRLYTETRTIVAAQWSSDSMLGRPISVNFRKPDTS